MNNNTGARYTSLLGALGPLVILLSLGISLLAFTFNAIYGNSLLSHSLSGQRRAAAGREMKPKWRKWILKIQATCASAGVQTRTKAPSLKRFVSCGGLTD